MNIHRIIDASVRHPYLIVGTVVCLVLGGIYSITRLPLDALPDLSDTQVIIQVNWDASADLIEDQITFPLTSALLSLENVRDIRGKSTYGTAWIYILFNDGTDLDSARTQVNEYLATVKGIPDDAQVQLGPDASGVGWIFQYVVTDRARQMAPYELRALHDDIIAPRLEALSGVAEVAAFGGYREQLEVQVNPELLDAYGVSFAEVARAVRQAHGERGARVLEESGGRYMLRLKGYVSSRDELENTPLKRSMEVEKKGERLYVKDVAHVSISPQPRHNAADFNGGGDAVGAVVVMRTGSDVMSTIGEIIQRLEDLGATLGPDIEITQTYNRRHLIERSLSSISYKLIYELMVVGLVIFVFLGHFSSSLIAVTVLPTAIIISMILMHLLGVTVNVMSAGGIAIAMGAMVDAALVMIESGHKHLLRLREEVEGEITSTQKITVIARALKEVAPSSFYSLLIVALSFLPIFLLERQEGRLFQPLAYAKTTAMIVAAVLSITLVPAACAWVLSRVSVSRATWLRPEKDHPLTCLLYSVYSPLLLRSLKYKKTVLVIATLMLAGAVMMYQKLGQEFLPPFNEGTILYMPTTLPGLSVMEAQKVLRQQGEILKSFPEVISVHGKAGRADTATDPAPMAMFETVVVLKDQREWRKKPRWYSDFPGIVQYPFKLITPEYLSYDELIAEMDQKMQFPGFTNAWTQPIKGRIDMLSTGVRTPVGVRVRGEDYREMSRIARNVEARLSDLEGTRSVFAERVDEGFYLDVVFDRQALALYGISLRQAHQQIAHAFSGHKVGEIVDGRRRYPLIVRYDRGFRDQKEDLENVRLSASSGAMIYVSDVADVLVQSGPAMISSDGSYPSSYVFVDLDTPDVGGYVEKAKKVLADISLPLGYSLDVVGEYESMKRVREGLRLVIPLALMIIVMMIYLNLRSVTSTLIVMAAVPFSLVGAFLALYLLGYQMSIAVWVGLVALIGVDIETAMFMLMYLQLSYSERKEKGHMNNREDLEAAVYEGAAKRLRPKFMMALTTVLALMPIMLASSADSGVDVMKRMVAPMVGGMVSSFLVELFVYPVVYTLWKQRTLLNKNA